MNENLERGSRWVRKKEMSPRLIYTILDADYEEVVASTEINLSTPNEDSFCWLSPLDEFLEEFTPLPKLK